MCCDPGCNFLINHARAMSKALPSSGGTSGVDIVIEIEDANSSVVAAVSEPDEEYNGGCSGKP